MGGGLRAFVDECRDCTTAEFVRRTMKLSPAPLSERAVGLAAAAVFVAGVLSAGLLDSGTGSDAPSLAAPASVSLPTGDGTGRSIDQLSLPPISPPRCCK